MSKRNRNGSDWKSLQEEDVTQQIYNKVRVKPKTKNQELYVHCIETYIATFCTGLPGTGKTFLAISLALDHLLNRHTKKIVLVRPLLECDEEIGFLPGGLDEKIQPYMLPFFDSLSKIIGDKRFIDSLFEEGKIEIRPLAFMKGSTFDDSFIILDEAEDCTYKQLKMMLTRLGFNSKIVVCGDINQSNLFNQNNKDNPLAQIIYKLRGMENVAHCVLKKEDVIRSKFVEQLSEKI